ncbi:MAG: VWA domain-containing protein [Bacteroidia bacterium]|nr:VWA domain-containing protein [Bacteroidia bacterium]
MNPIAWQDIRFEDRGLLLLLIVPVLMGAWRIWQRKRLEPTIRISTLRFLTGMTHPFRARMRQALPWSRLVTVSLVIMALARPQTAFREEEVSVEGIDIIVAIDISESMDARDFTPDRMTAAKATAAAFIRNRKKDRIGLVAFAGESFTQCPPTTDHEVLLAQLDMLRSGLLERGTAIGMGLSTSVLRLKDSEAKSRVVILLTDGVNNSGFVDPLSAADAAAHYGIRVHTIAVGKNGKAPFLLQSVTGEIREEWKDVELDEALLREIAATTKGKYFHVENEAALTEVYQEIDRMEKARLSVKKLARKTELFAYFLSLAGILFLIELLLRYTWLRSIP